MNAQGGFKPQKAAFFRLSFFTSTHMDGLENKEFESQTKCASASGCGYLLGIL